uniref:CDP-diacylglycerol--inositol 3-phosphatidyltransferase n=1 Tax=Oryctolagus cuniculus TaxID=9986 RepID=G1TWS0_RABIT
MERGGGRKRTGKRAGLKGAAAIFKPSFFSHSISLLNWQRLEQSSGLPEAEHSWSSRDPCWPGLRLGAGGCASPGRGARAPCAPRTAGSAPAPAACGLEQLGPGRGRGLQRAVGGAGTALAPPGPALGGEGAGAMPGENIFLFVPNLIGTRFGAMLDMLTDRCATMCLLVNLALLYPRATLLFQLSMSLDVASHWLHLHSSVVRGSESHKMIDLSGNPVLRIYYTSRPALFTLCAGNELFYCLLYLFNFSEGPLVGSVGLFRVGLWVTAPIALLKSLISIIHLVTAARNMAALDAADRAKKK